MASMIPVRRFRSWPFALGSVRLELEVRGEVRGFRRLPGDRVGETVQGVVGDVCEAEAAPRSRDPPRGQVLSQPRPHAVVLETGLIQSWLDAQLGKTRPMP